LRYDQDRKISEVFWDSGCASVLKHELIVLKKYEIATDHCARLAKNNRLAKNLARLGQQVVANGQEVPNARMAVADELGVTADGLHDIVTERRTAKKPKCFHFKCPKLAHLRPNP